MSRSGCAVESISDQNLSQRMERKKLGKKTGSTRTGASKLTGAKRGPHRIVVNVCPVAKGRLYKFEHSPTPT
jgi:hypothetical protein